jgi:capsular exopolysaccharide synthesis family protein
MLQQLKQASLSSALRASNIRVVDPATPPKRPYKPDILLGSGLGLMSGIFFGAAFLVMRERADRSIQEPGETGMYLDLPELGVIPSDQIGPRVRVRLVGSKANGKEQPLQLPEPELPQRVELVTWQRKPSMVAESFRAALVSILFSGENGNRPRVLVVTSCSPGEGKSTVASNLGIAVAEVNQKVLLIDADLRKPRIHDIFNLKNDHGLSDLLQSTDSSTALPQGIIQETNVANLYVLTSGKSTSAATSLLYSGRMPELLKALRNEFETIIVDTPPMLQIPDARVVGRMVDRVILVVRAGKTTRDAIMAANQKFAEDGTRVLGTILNDWNPKNSPGGYYGYYNGYYNSYYKHGYGAESKKA